MPRFRIRDYTYGVSFNGTTSFLAKASPTGINNGTNGSVTISGWVYLTSNVLGTFAELHVNGGTSPSFGMGQSGGQYYVFSDRVNVGNNKTITTAAFNNSVGLNRWVMLTYVLTSTNITVYAGATAILPTAALGASISAGTISSLFIGKGQDVGQSDIQFLSGIIKDFRIFNGALTSTEVSNLYYNGVSPASIASAFVMGEGSGTTVADSVGSNSLTATAITWSLNTPLGPRFLSRNANAAILANGANGAAGNILSIANNASLNPTAAVTVEIWHRPRSLKAAILFDNSTAGVTNSYYASIGADLSLLWYSTIGGVAKNITTTTSKLKLNEWNFITATYDGANIYLFANGAQFGTLAATGALGTNSGSLFIGAYYTGAAGSTVDGALYNPRIYSAGCTLAEHQDRYYRGITSTALQAALELDLDTNRGAGTTVLDLSGNGNTATLGAGASWSGDVPFKSRKASVNANMVKNGDFEYAPPFTAATSTAARWIDGTSGGSATNSLFSWAFLTKSGSGQIQYDTSVSFSGAASLKLSTTATTSNVEAANVLTASNADVLASAIRVSPNTSYVMSVRLKTFVTSGDSNDGAYLLASLRDATGAGITSASTTKVKTTTDWTLYTTTFTTTSATAFIYLRLNATGSTGTATLIMDAWFDDISLTPVYPEGRVPANGNLVKNFDFEVVPAFTAETTTAARWIDGTAGGSTTNSTYKWATVSGAITPSASVSYDTTVFHSGSASLKLSTLNTSGAAVAANTLNTASPADASVMLRLLPSTAYTLSFYLKTNNVATNGAYAFIREYSGALSTLVTTNSTKLSGTNDWTLVTLNFTTNAATQFAALALLNNVPGNVSDAWFDDIYLAPTTNPGRVAIT